MPIFVYPTTTRHHAVPAKEFTTALTEKVVWIDLLKASPAEVLAVELALGVALSRLVQYAGHEDFDEGGEGPASPIYPRLKPVTRDLQSLSEFAGFLSSKVSFMLDATLGLINIGQNAIVKIFTVAAVILLPPTLVASVYGMNFDHMPELHMKLGYPFAILLMVMSAIVPYWDCRRKGWL